MSEPIHGHEVMNMMVASTRSYTRTSLHAAITGRFGHDVRFYTCSAAGSTGVGPQVMLEPQRVTTGVKGLLEAFFEGVLRR